jgi:hypothetical protein
MPVNILDIPPEERIAEKFPSLWVWGCTLISVYTAYIYVFLAYLPQYLSRNSYVFWSELLLIPLLLWGALFSFRLILWNSRNIEATHWNNTRSNYYNELLRKGRTNIEIIDLQIRIPDLKGGVSNMAGNSLIPMRYVPKKTHMARYLFFNSPVKDLINIHQIQKRKFILFDKIMNGMIDDIYIHFTLLPKKTKIICVLDDDLRPKMENIWRLRFEDVFPVTKLEFKESLSDSIDNWLDDSQSEYVIFIAANFFGNESFDELVDGKSESMMFLLGKKNREDTMKNLSFGHLFRPEIDWKGIDKSLIWGGAPHEKKLSGVIYSGLDETEKNDLVLKTAGMMSEGALSSFKYIDTSNNFCLSPPLTEFLQLNYIESYLGSGDFLIINKHDDCLVSYFFNSTSMVMGEL